MVTKQRHRRRARSILGPSLVACVVAGALAPIPAAAAEKDPVFATRGNLAIRGYDPVAYFTEGEAVKGRKEFTLGWQGADWRFANEENRDLFADAPEKYAPQYGGYCAYAVSQGYTAKIDPEAWKIVDDKLYLNFSLKVQKIWEKDIPGYIASADVNWPKILSGE